MLAITFFEKRYHNDPLLLQYAHRVLEQHPVELTFFFVPQVVQALRYDELGESSISLLRLSLQHPAGYVARFILETAKISQLFCHQIIWNMKANCYKDDAGEAVGYITLRASQHWINNVTGRPDETCLRQDDGHGGGRAVW